MKLSKERLDLVLVKQGLAASRTEARGLIMSGKVVSKGKKLDKAGYQVAGDAVLELVGTPKPFVSRGGWKLQHALKTFKIDPEGKRALDIGASTGGFTDCLLQHGAVSVVALDVGYNQLAWKLRQDPRVMVLEKTNVRYLDPSGFSPFDLIVIDVSFISLKLVLPVAAAMIPPRGRIIALIKPQFEVGKGEVGKGGIVRDPEQHRRVIEQVKEFARSCGLKLREVIPSPIEGAKGNREFLGLLDAQDLPGL